MIPLSSTPQPAAFFVVLCQTPQSAEAISKAIAHQGLAHGVRSVFATEALIALVDGAAAPRPPADAIILDLRHFADALPCLAARRHRLGSLVVAHAAGNVPDATVELASDAGAYLLAEPLAERDAASSFVTMMTERMRARHNRSRSAK